ncbi:MAG: hypothetical protein GXO87_00175 [Chlorobi bacterium]|nr:hypothetical protein [Chlorobiota bacterium]
MSKKKKNKYGAKFQDVNFQGSPVSVKRNGEVFFFLLTIIIGAYFYFSSLHEHIQDDTFIFLRYAQNFVHGNGLVFNPGEYVEGFTGFLWLALITILQFLKEDLVQSVTLISMIFGGTMIYFTYKLSTAIQLPFEAKTTEIKEREKIAKGAFLFDLIPPLLLALNGAVHYWAGSGMETMLYSTFLTAGLYYFLSRDVKEKYFLYSAIYLTLASLTRPEGLLVIAVVLMRELVFLFEKEKSFASSIKKLFSGRHLQFILIVFVPNFLLMLFRLFYYGYPLPNTFYAKAGFSPEYISNGFEYFTRFASAYLLWGILLLLPLILLKKKEVFGKITLLYSIVILYSLYIIFIGGDVLPVNRFFIPILPAIYVLLGKALLEIYYFLSNKFKKSSFKFAVLISFVIITALGSYTFLSQRNYIVEKEKLEKNLVEKMTASGKWFAMKQNEARKQLTVAATTIGALGYYSGTVLIDMLGLTDETIAHNPQPIEEISGKFTGWKERNYNVEYVLSRKPDYIFFSTGLKPSAFAERALFTSEKFLIEYFNYFIYYPHEKISTNVYKRKPDAVLKADILQQNKNPNYSKDYVNLYTKVLHILPDPKSTGTAIKICKKLKRVAPSNFSETYRLLGELYTRKGDEETGLKSYKHAVAIDKFNTTALGSLLGYSISKKDTNGIRYYGYILSKIDPDVLVLYGMN